jgi:hypothetical protein
MTLKNISSLTSQTTKQIGAGGKATLLLKPSDEGHALITSHPPTEISSPQTLKTLTKMFLELKTNLNSSMSEFGYCLNLNSRILVCVRPLRRFQPRRIDYRLTRHKLILLEAVCGIATTTLLTFF